MPSTLVHVAVGGLVGAGLLGRWFDARLVGVALVVAAVPDLDSFTSTHLSGNHRALLHTLLLPLVLAALVAHDTRMRDPERSAIRGRWGARGVAVAWVGVAALLCGGILPDLFTNGVNAFYPLHDAFYSISGRAEWSSTRGFAQTFVELRPASPPPTTETLHYNTVVDPSPGAEPENVERVAPLASSGTELMFVVLGAGAVGGRLLSERLRGPAGEPAE